MGGVTKTPQLCEDFQGAVIVVINKQFNLLVTGSHWASPRVSAVVVLRRAQLFCRCQVDC